MYKLGIKYNKSQIEKDGESMLEKYNLKALFIKPQMSEEEILRKNIKWALKELNFARQNFDMVAGAENVELAIYELNAAERRYQNLMNQAKKAGFTAQYHSEMEMDGAQDGITG